MAVKPGADFLTLCEQIIEDPITGLTLQFSVVPNASAPFRLRIFGAMAKGTREYFFDADGKESMSVTVLSDSCRPTWLRKVGS
jgi:hypothetical protein